MADSILLKDLLVLTKDGEWGKGEPTSDNVEMLVIRGADFPAVRYGDLSGVPTRYIPEQIAERKRLEANDILIETAGGTTGRPTGRTVFLKPRLFQQSKRPITCASFSRFLRVNTDIAEPEYVFWYLQFLYETGQMEQHQVQHTGIARFQYTKFAQSLEIPLLPLPEQKAIARILSSLDDKIELNQQMNGTLEAIAWAIFKSWFVDFDPVRAKMDGRQPAGMDAATADLFPDEFEDSPLGKIPKGWKVTTLGDVVSIKHGYAFKSEFFSEPAPGLPIVVNIGNFKYTGGFRFESTTLKGYVGEFPEEFILSPGDILLVMTCQTAGGEILGIPGHIPNNGRTYLHNQRMGKVVITDSDRVDQHFLYQLFLLPEFNRELFVTASGTKILHTSPSRIEAFQFCLPPIKVQRAIARVLRNLECKIASNEMESKILTNIRDVLLPKLLAGEIQVKEAKKLLAAST